MISIVIGFILDWIIGDPQNPYHPVRFIGNLGQGFEKIFRKIFKNSLRLAGLLTWIFVVLISFFVPFILIYFLNKLNPIIGIIVSGIIIYFCIASKGLKTEGLKVIKVLKSGDIIEARKRLSYIVGRDTENLDEEAIVRAVIETVAENMSDGIIAPLFFIGIGGAPFGMIYKAVNTCDSMFGYKNEKYKDFGFFPAKLDDIFNYIPARLTGYFIIISSFILRLDFKNSFKIYKRDKYNHTSPNSAHPEAAVAGALNIRLGGENYYFGKIVKKPTIGDKKKTIEISDLHKTNNILLLVSILGLILSVAIRGVII
ncbi:cobalamin biosynthesis protein [Clostridium thermobutyricum]|uniref:Cobalamin biosynthesis protein CobD n=1 Tax=Clostridium thermobutyricum DSM 4928 TaxID=1121339 RepID=A0A1V4SVQ7_9CLOT|nr:cobalamin biosynthesis protein [Clostridium thermobutyricum]OPX48201.1 cobalamin biosynthesis protein CbiB [Clostridium thermobutyricum DSM 4928]